MALALTLGMTATSAPAPVAAQNLFAPAIRVNDLVITRYELEQRARMLKLFNAPGDPAKLARKQLIEERLKLDAARSLGLQVTEDEVLAGMEEFAGRANMNTEQFLRALEGAGVSAETFRAFVEAGVSWRLLVRARFSRQVEITENDVERALSSNRAAGVEVLISEIIMPLRSPRQRPAIEARAREISELTSTSAFSAQARRYSASPTRGRGGRLNWMPITQLPPTLQPLILGLAPGQVTDPLPLQGAVALFQLRDIREGKRAQPEYSAIEYAAYYIHGGHTPEGLAVAARLRKTVDTCDDLYGVAKGQPEEVLERGSKAPGDIPTDIALELAKLDKHEVSTALTRANGQTLVFLMLCGRSTKVSEDVDRDQVSMGLRNRRLESYAKGYLEQLRAEARIVE
ncbi:MAG: peptidylprolyl isomerase [Rhodobacterales bacterium]|nr:MAG: peptidylprolyl isomerase [Rhodobacterales bacterium]